MSPPSACNVSHTSGFPRVSGDEPTETMGAVGIVKFSPRERG